MRIALVDDDVSQHELINQSLDGLGHSTHCFATGSAFLRDLARESFDLLVLDWQLPDTDGPALLKKMREHQRMPVLFVTSRAAEEDIVNALSAGADDYMVKPLRKHELVARVQALLRRAYPTSAQAKVFTFEGYTFDTVATTVKANGEDIVLTQKEFDLALIFFRNLGKPLSRAHIMESVWGRDDDVPTRTMDTHVSRVRSRLNLRPEQGYRLSPVYSYGYRLDRVSPADL
jgi:DNA-binding response OmpR family regulator